MSHLRAVLWSVLWTAVGAAAVGVGAFAWSFARTFFGGLASDLARGVPLRLLLTGDWFSAGSIPRCVEKEMRRRGLEREFETALRAAATMRADATGAPA